MLRLFIFLIGLMLMQSTSAKSLSLVINGKAIHEKSRNFNEDNWGLGFEYNFLEGEKWIYFVNAGFFEDSIFNTSKHIGVGSKRRFLLTENKGGMHIDVALNAFFMTRKDYKNNTPFLAALPFLSVGTNKAALNITYIPSVSPKYESLWFFQMTMQVAKW